MMPLFKNTNRKIQYLIFCLALNASGAPIEFRPCTNADELELIDFLNQAKNETKFHTFRPEETFDQEWVRHFLEKFGSHQELHGNIIALDGKKILGIVHFGPYSNPTAQNTPAGPKMLARFGILILKEAWGLGIGKRFIHQMQEVLKLRNFQTVGDFVHVENQRAIDFYEKLGFCISDNSEMICSHHVRPFIKRLE